MKEIFMIQYKCEICDLILEHKGQMLKHEKSHNCTHENSSYRLGVTFTDPPYIERRCKDCDTRIFKDLSKVSLDTILKPVFDSLPEDSQFDEGYL